MQAKILPSRAALVDRIALQFEYGQNLIALLGTSGLGKSYLLETFITDKYSEFNKAFVQVTAAMTDAQCMTSLLEQSFSAPLIDHTLSLTENFNQLHQQQQCGSCLWVIDDAKHLSDEMVTELETLAKYSPTTLYIMVALPTKGLFTQAVEIHLEPLSLKESKQLMQYYFTKLPYDEDPIFTAFLSEAKGNPGLLLAWQAEQQIEQPSKDSMSWRVHLITLLLIIMLLIVGLLYQNDMRQWWQNNTQTEQANEAVETALDVVKLIATEPKVAPESEPELALEFDVTNAAQVEKRAQHKEHELSDLPSDTVQATAQQHNDVPAILQSLTAVEQAGIEGVEPATSASSTRIVENKPAEPQVNNDSSWYLTQPNSYFAIQLLAVTQEQVSRDFIARYQLQPTAKLYQTRRDDKIWWIVTYGSYSNIAQAKQALLELPAAIQKNKPFFKKMSKIKQEIERLDQKNN